MKRTAEEFKAQAKVKNITQWPGHNCPKCGYTVGYYFQGENVFFDNGCDCFSGQNLKPRTWEEVANRYNMQTHPDVIKKMDEHWGFINN